MKLTDTQQRMIDILNDNGGTLTGTANLGFLMWPDPCGDSRTDSRRPQGMALAAGKIARQLKDAGLINSYGQPTTFKLCA